ncbi:hypothetical protein BASA83_006216 [Batrachochytrium salamandrivorans]|nr:hypothetical protein BASA83_006216 [Batrachochytrium salamandrivorans]
MLISGLYANILYVPSITCIAIAFDQGGLYVDVVYKTDSTIAATLHKNAPISIYMFGYGILPHQFRPVHHAILYLLSFVAVVSNAAALPQPAEISDKHSSNVDIALASFLSARSYQPELNSQKNSATLMSLERRADSDGASGGNGELNNIFRVTRFAVGAVKFADIFRAFVAARAESARLADKKEREVTGAVLNILAKTGTVIENVNTINTSFKEIFSNRIALFTLLGSPLKFES